MPKASPPSESAVESVYSELRRLAAHYLRRERSGHTLQPTALVHEAYLRLSQQREVQWDNRRHFLGVAAPLMRRILVDHCRGRQAAKRGGAAARVTLDHEFLPMVERAADVVSLDEALKALGEFDPQQARIVELRFFSGLSIEDTAEVLGVSASTVKREWNVAKAWLAREIRAADG